MSTAVTESGQAGSSRVVRGFVWATAVVWVLLAATGVYLFLFYRPPATAAFDDVAALADSASLSNAIRTVHRVLSVMAIFLSIGVFVVFVLQARRGRAVGAALLFVVTVFTSFTGYLLPWDQLALRAVTVGSDIRGFRPIFDDNVVFVLMGGVEVGAATLRRWLIVHVVVAPIVALVIVFVTYVRTSRSAGAAGSPTLESADQSPKPS